MTITLTPDIAVANLIANLERVVGLQPTGGHMSCRYEYNSGDCCIAGACMPADFRRSLADTWIKTPGEQAISANEARFRALVLEGLIVVGCELEDDIVKLQHDHDGLLVATAPDDIPRMRGEFRENVDRFIEKWSPSDV